MPYHVGHPIRIKGNHERLPRRGILNFHRDLEYFLIIIYSSIRCFRESVVLIRCTDTS
jgi:hypothetical protein